MFDFYQRLPESPSPDVWGLFKFLLIYNHTLVPVSHMSVLFTICGFACENEL